MNKLQSLFGQFTWQPPLWFRSLSDTASRRPGRTGAVVVLIVLLILFAAQGWRFFQPAPSPDALAVDVQVPELGETGESGIIGQALRIDFSDSAADLKMIDETLKTGIRMEPVMEGSWYWEGDRRLAFYPAKNWPAAQRFKVSLDRSLFGPGVKLARYDLDFETKPLSHSIESMEFYVDPRDPTIRQVTATLKFSHAMALHEVEKRLSLQGKGLDQLYVKDKTNEKSFRLESRDFGRTFYFRSKPLNIPDKETLVHLRLEKESGPLGWAGSGKAITRSLLLPDLSGFLRISSCQLQIVSNREGDPEQTLMLESTLGIDRAELQKHLEVYLLPLDKPARENSGSRYRHSWRSVNEVDEGVLRQSEKVPVTVKISKADHASLHAVTLSLPVKRGIYVRVGSGLKGLGGFVLKKAYEQVLTVPDYPREVRIMNEGAVLAQSGERTLSLLTRGVERVEWRLGKVPASQINHLVSQSEGSFQNPYFRNYSFGEDNLAQTFYQSMSLDVGDPAVAKYTALDFLKMLQGQEDSKGLFFLEVAEQRGTQGTPERLNTGNPDYQPQQSRWEDQTRYGNGNKVMDRRFVLITDLGILVKDNRDGSHDVFIQSIRTGLPVAGAEVQVVGKNGVAVATETSDREGRASLPRVFDLKREKAPVAFVVKRGSDVSFLPYNRADRRLNLSRFDIGGIAMGDGKNLSAFLFSDRGIYRPGDRMNLGLVVRSFDWGSQPAGLPLELEITNARGVVAYSRKFNLNAEGFMEFDYTTPESASTGSYAASVYLVKNGSKDQLLGSAPLRVEEFLPDRMKIKAVLSDGKKEGWISPKDLKIAVELNNLYGNPAVDHRIQGEINLTPAVYAFSRYPDYQFHDPEHQASRALSMVQENLSDAKSDDHGRTLLPLELGRFGGGVYNLRYVVRGFEAGGGRSVAAGGTALISSRPFLIGSKPDGDLAYLRVNSQRQIGFLAVQPDLSPMAQEKLKLKVFELRTLSVLTKQANGNYAYQSIVKEIPVSEEGLDIPAGGIRWTVPTAEPGDYVARLVDGEETNLSQIRFSVVGAANLSRSLEKNAELQVKLSRQEYKSGDDISLSVTAPYRGAGLITIERDRVYASKWFRTDTTSSTQTITLPAVEGLEGNAYVNVTLVRSLDSQEIYSSPLSTAVVPFRINREKRTVQIQLKAPEKTVPGAPLPITFQTDRPCKVVVFAVDEGILQVARYTLPNPLDHFLQKRSLEVGTSQIMDLILPEYSLTRSAAAAGGDGGEDLLAANLNPFKRKREKPVVFWSGIVEAGTKEQTVYYQVPDYFNGSLRIMAVAVGAEAAGASETQALVKGPFILQPNVPSFVAPGDRFEVSVSVANNREGSGSGAGLDVSLAAGDQLEVISQPEGSVIVPEGKEKTLTYQLRAKNKLGNADLVFTARQAGEEARSHVSLSIRPPSPFLTRVRSGWSKAGSFEVKTERELYPDYRKGEAVVSLLPTGFIRGLQLYLEDYPHLCSEQLTSRAFPTLLLDDGSGSGLSRSQRVEALEKIIHVLRTRQNDQGAIGLWQAHSDLQFDFPSVYAVHLLTEMKERGYEVLETFFQRALGHLEQMATETPGTFSEARVQAYAIYLLTRNGRITTNYLNKLRTTLDQDHAKVWGKDLTALYCAGSYALLQNKRESERILGGFKIMERVKTDDDDFHSNLSRDSQYLDLTARHFPERLNSVTAEELQEMVEPLAQGDFTTYSAAYAVLGLRAYARTVSRSEQPDISLYEKFADGELHPLKPEGELFQTAGFSQQAKALKIKATGVPVVFYQVIEAGFDQVESERKLTPFHQGLEVQRDYLNRKGEKISQAELGEEVQVRVRVRSIKHDYVENVAILDLLPGGFEVVNDSIRQANPETDEEAGTGSKARRLYPDYVDVREDRVVVYATVEPEVQEFVYEIRATNRGEYHVPPVQGESMYRREIQSRGTEGTFKVGGEQK